MLYDPNNNLISSINFDENDPTTTSKRFLPKRRFKVPKEMLSPAHRAMILVIRLFFILGMAYFFLLGEARNVVICYWLAFSCDLLTRSDHPSSHPSRLSSSSIYSSSSSSSQQQSIQQQLYNSQCLSLALFGDYCNVFLLYLFNIVSFLRIYPQQKYPLLYAGLLIPCFLELASKVTIVPTSSDPLQHSHLLSEHGSSHSSHSSQSSQQGESTTSQTPHKRHRRSHLPNHLDLILHNDEGDEAQEGNHNDNRLLSLSNKTSTFNSFDFYDLFRCTSPILVSLIGLFSELFLLVLWQR
jgi:hypothetical protein